MSEPAPHATPPLPPGENSSGQHSSLRDSRGFDAGAAAIGTPEHAVAGRVLGAPLAYFMPGYMPIIDARIALYQLDELIDISLFDALLTTGRLFIYVDEP